MIIKYSYYLRRLVINYGIFWDVILGLYIFYVDDEKESFYFGVKNLG